MNGASLAEEATIVAVSTPPGRGAIGIVRISGPAAGLALRHHCRFKRDILAFPRRMLVGEFLDLQGQVIDRGLAVYHPAPHSYTGEDLAELFLHGNPLLLQRLIDTLGQQRGIRPAEPGEFTKRAYLHGKLDITEAEAVQRLIAARSEWELMASRKNLQGALKRMVSRFRSGIIHLKAEIEADLDFSTEDLALQSKQERIEQVELLLEDLEGILQRSQITRRICSGIQAVLVGPPNAGKSSLFNQILGWERAIVSAEAGTTRDYVSEEIQLKGVTLSLIDTAGLREVEGEIERKGIHLSKQLIQQSQIVLHVIDGARPPYPYPEILEGASTQPSIKEASAQAASARPSIKASVIHVINKSDLESSKKHSLPAEASSARVSCATGEGMEALQDLLCEHIFLDASPADAILLEERHRRHLLRARDALQKTVALWEQRAPDEIVALEVDRALENIGAISGRIDNEEILGRIFSLFCVGK